MNIAIGLTVGRADLGTEATEAKIAELQRSPASHAPPPKVAQRARIELVPTSVGWPCYELVVPGRDPLVDVIYLHGGAYIAEIGGPGWRYAANLAADLRARVLVPIYPLAPTSTAVRTVAEAIDVVAELSLGATRPVILVGDSAGGGLALATAVGLRDEGRALPDHLAIQAPWFDASLQHPGIAAQLPLDRVLNLEHLGVAAKAYVGDLSFDDPRVSPIRADLRGLPPITLHVGTLDLGLPDARDFNRLARAAGVTVDFHEAAGQVHGYWVLNLPEAKQLRRDLSVVARRLAGVA